MKIIDGEMRRRPLGIQIRESMGGWKVDDAGHSPCLEGLREGFCFVL
jgi:hypothetical protein